MGKYALFNGTIATLSALLPLLYSESAHADGSIGAGLFIGTLVSNSPHFYWGVEAFWTQSVWQESRFASAPRAGLGPLARATFISDRETRYTLSLHGGRELERGTNVDIELGVTLANIEHRLCVFPHTGFQVEALGLNLHTRQEWLLSEASLGAGLRFPPTYGFVFGGSAAGRPLRDGRGTAKELPRLHCAGAFEHRCRAAQRWARRAREECASIPAFVQLADELLDVGAPRSLVTRALAAAADELAHTRAALRLAEHFGGAPLAVAPINFKPRPRLPRPAALQRLTSEAWADGCLNEGLAAAIAKAESAVTLDRLEARLSADIARDEASHAALALDILRWAQREDAWRDGPSSSKPLELARRKTLGLQPSLLNDATLRALAHDTTVWAARELA